MGSPRTTACRASNYRWEKGGTPKDTADRPKSNSMPLIWGVRAPLARGWIKYFLVAMIRGGGRHGSGEGREPSLRGRAAGRSRRAPRFPHQRDSDLAEPESALALPQQHPGRLLRPQGKD